jgi:hypothetical protein
MTTVSHPQAGPAIAPPDRAPHSRLVQRAAAVSLVLAGLLNGGAQYVGHLVIGDLDFSDQIRWGAEHPAFHGVEQALLVESSLFLLVGLLGVAHLCRFGARRLTALATPLVVWGMWGFTNVLAMGYVTGTVARDALSVEAAVGLNDALVSDPGVVVTALLPHLVGSFFGLLLLSVAAWRSGAFPRPAVLLLLAFLVWDFLLPPVGPLEAHLLLAVAWSWMGWHIWRASDAAWTGRSSEQGT